jgi:hypothetical protein
VGVLNGDVAEVEASEFRLGPELDEDSRKGEVGDGRSPDVQDLETEQLRSRYSLCGTSVSERDVVGRHDGQVDGLDWCWM